MSLSAGTIRTYENALKRVESLGIDKSNPDLDSLLSQLTSDSVSLSSQNMCLMALNWYNKSKLHDEVLSENITLRSQDLRGRIMTSYGSNELSDRERDIYISWSTILKIHADMSKKVLTSDDNRLQDSYVLLSLYVLHPPRRSDYAEMYISDMSLDDYHDRVISVSDPYSNEWYNHSCTNRLKRLTLDVEKKTSKNYYVLSGYFVFDEYKTYKSYGRQVIKLSKSLNDILVNHINRKKLVVGDSLLGLSYANYLKRLSGIFDSYVGKSVSIDILRHSYISDLIPRNVTLNERKKISLLMGHSVTTQEIYNKSQSKVDDTEVVINTESILDRKTCNKYATEAERREKRLEGKRASYHKNQLLKKGQNMVVDANDAI